VEEWFAARLAPESPPTVRRVGLESLRLGLVGAGPIDPAAAESLALLTRWVVTAGGTVVVSQAGLAANAAFARPLGLGDGPLEPTLSHGQIAARAGFHVMEQSGDHWGEALTGLGATGVEVIVGHVGEHPLPGHPLVPVLQVSSQPEVLDRYGADLDATWRAAGAAAHGEGIRAWATQALECVVDVAARRRQPKLMRSGNTDFQISRGPLGVSL
jgi:hypothetical protein